MTISSTEVSIFFLSFIFSFRPEAIEESNVETGFEVYIKPEVDYVSEIDRPGFESKDDDDKDDNYVEDGDPSRLSLSRWASAKNDIVNIEIMGSEKWKTNCGKIGSKLNKRSTVGPKYSYSFCY
jgi:hypothetical protein